jgi:hypothetical protein
MKSNAFLLPVGEVARLPNAGQHVYFVYFIYADVFDARAHAFIVLRRSCIEIGRECGLEYSCVVSRVVYAARQLQQPLHVVTLQA